MPIFYCVSKDLLKDGYFYPRIPKNRDWREDASVTRICVSKHLDGCFTSMPGGNLNISNLNHETHGIFKVFRIDTEKLGISPENIIDTDVLYQTNKVQDAYWTDECWILEPFTVPDEDISLINLHHWETDEVENVPYDVRELADELDGDIEEACIQLYAIDDMEYISTVENVQYGVIGKDNLYTFFFKDCYLSEIHKVFGDVEYIKSLEIISAIEYESKIDVLYTNVPETSKVVMIEVNEDMAYQEDFKERLILLHRICS